MFSTPYIIWKYINKSIEYPMRRKRALPGHIDVSPDQQVVTDMFGDENHDLSQSQTSRRREKLSELQKGLIREIVSDYCPRVTGANLEDYGMFTTPEAKIKPGSNRASYHQEIPFIKMTIEILKLSERDRTFDGKDGQAYARE